MEGSSKMNKHENEFTYAVQVTRVILRMIGAWPLSNYVSNVERIATRLQNICCYFLFAFTIIPGFLLMFLKERDYKRKVKLLAPILNSWASCVKYSLLVYHAREIHSCLKQARQDWMNTVDLNSRKAMLSNAKIGRQFAIVSAIFMYISGLFFRVIVPLSKGRMLTPMNTTVRALPCPSYFVKFNEQASPAYEIVFILQFFAGLITYSVTVGVAGLAAFFVMHICGQLSVLIGKLKCLNNILEPEDRTVTILLADIVEHHIRVKGFLKQVEETMRFVWLLEIVSSTLFLCLTGYYVIMEWENNNSTATFTYSVMLASLTFSIFTNCYVGQLLTDQSSKFGLMAATMKWYRLPHKRSRSLILIMAVSNIPAKISAGKLIDMSLLTFSNVSVEAYL
ncbi:odorant receptor 85b isoform X2 [Monomorium pharaonis]|uniref:odorant receptor 85b isoform X2 n=1 Tax=Monomorium pharaonis TaxID=307658 RepID=UPI00174772BE|nr:odorant receptor 85b isoform X2 [Monomorium pharaonis]